jgi:hypothetical protein
VDDLGGDKELKTVRGRRHLAPRYKRVVKECIIVGSSPIPLEVPLEAQLYIRSVRACVQLYLYINVYSSKSSY